MTSTHSTETSSYQRGFASLENEIDIERLPVTGTLPSWLSGELVRNGPAKFEAGKRRFRHWFDGQAMLHRFGIHDGNVSYRNRFLDTPAMRSVRDTGKIGYDEFATDPCKSIFRRMFTMFRSRKSTSNTNINLVSMGEDQVALTETQLGVRFDRETLETLGMVKYQDDLSGQLTTAHPHLAPRTGELINYLLKYGKRSEYQVYRQRGTTRERLASLTADLPSYLHSFAITEDHVVLVMYPFVVNPLSMLLGGKTFIENYRWRPELGTRFVVINLVDGSVQGEYRADPCFAFHHINAYVDGDEVVVDLSGYPDTKVIDALYLDHLRGHDKVPMATPTRYRLDLNGDTITTERITDQALELPRINYERHNGRPYRYAYGVGSRTGAGENFFDQLVKVNVTDGSSHTWAEPDCHPGEPVFVAAPDATAEDEGVVLSVVFDGRSGTSFLVVLDASSFTELARAAVPHGVPFGFHGQFSPAT